eukprot:6944021-Prymnesium_polylepis.1
MVGAGASLDWASARAGGLDKSDAYGGGPTTASQRLCANRHGHPAMARHVASQAHVASLHYYLNAVSGPSGRA